MNRIDIGIKQAQKVCNEMNECANKHILQDAIDEIQKQALILIGVTCCCGSIIKDDNIDLQNSCNEEGEEYYEGYAKCNKCNKEWEWNEWGEYNSLAEAKEELQDYINNNCK